MAYNEIIKLRDMLAEKGFEKSLIEFSDGYQIRLADDISVIECSVSYGNEEDLLELYGGLTTKEEQEEGGAIGNLTAEEIVKRFMYCLKNNTDTYKDESKEKKCMLTKREVKMIKFLIEKAAISVKSEGTPDYCHTVYELDENSVQKLAADLAIIFGDNEE